LRLTEIKLIHKVMESLNVDDAALLTGCRKTNKAVYKNDQPYRNQPVIAKGP
jgi:hypothetical protein